MTFQVPSAGMEQIINTETIRFVLSWGTSIDLDLHSRFAVSSKNICHVFFGNKSCMSMTHSGDKSYDSTIRSGMEAISIDKLGSYRYVIYASNYQGNGYDLQLSGGVFSMYTQNFQQPLFTTDVPNSIESESKRFWIILCLDGSKGISSLKKINKLVNVEPTYNVCDQYF